MKVNAYWKGWLSKLNPLGWFMGRKSTRQRKIQNSGRPVPRRNTLHGDSYFVTLTDEIREEDDYGLSFFDLATILIAIAVLIYCVVALAVVFIFRVEPSAVSSIVADSLGLKH